MLDHLIYEAAPQLTVLPKQVEAIAAEPFQRRIDVGLACQNVDQRHVVERAFEEGRHAGAIAIGDIDIVRRTSAGIGAGVARRLLVKVPRKRFRWRTAFISARTFLLLSRNRWASLAELHVDLPWKQRSGGRSDQPFEHDCRQCTIEPDRSF